MMVILSHIYFFPKSYNPFHFPISLSVKDVYPWIDKIYNATIPFRPSPLTFIIFCRLPVPRPGQVLGLVGTNGIGKSTALKILAGKTKPNLGKFTVSKIEHLFIIPAEVTLSYELYLPILQDLPNWDDIPRHFRGSELQKYFTRLLEDKMKVLLQLYLLAWHFVFPNQILH